MIFLWIYCIVLAGLITLYYVLFQHEKKLSMSITQQSDELLYIFDKGVFDSRKHIFDYETTKELVFHNQKQFFSQGKVYDEMLPRITKDCQYLSDLTHTEIIDENSLNSLAEVHTTRQKIHTLRRQTHIILIILTLWLAKLLLP